MTSFSGIGLPTWDGSEVWRVYFMLFEKHLRKNLVWSPVNFIQEHRQFKWKQRNHNIDLSGGLVRSSRWKCFDDFKKR